jgi:hypothetical protein
VKPTVKKGGEIMDVRKEMKKLVEAAEVQKKVAGIFELLLKINDDKLCRLRPIVEAVTNLGSDFERLDNKEEDGLDHWQYMIDKIARIIEMIGKGDISYSKLEGMEDKFEKLLTAVSYLPEPLRHSQAIGAMELVARAKRLRIRHDLAGAAINWRDRLGDPVENETTEKLQEDYPFLVPVVFNSRIILSEPTLYGQFFGLQPGLRALEKDKMKILRAACVRWPLKDFFAFSPVPTWSADKKGEKLWFEEYTWREQMEELVRLRRKYPGVTVRFATLPELMFLDFCWRLANEDSPVGIYSFRCQHPLDDSKCLRYGNVSDYGAKIEDDIQVWETGALPLFILNIEGK